jgi:hypothetical protein
MNRVESFGLRFREAHGFDRHDLKFRCMNAAQYVRGDSSADGIRLDNC